MTLHLLPQPKSLTLTPGTYKIPPLGWIVLDPAESSRDYFAADRLAQQLEALTAVPWKIARDRTGTRPPSSHEIRCLHDPSIPHDQGYALTITPGGIELRARTAPGMFYAMQTLTQIVRQAIPPTPNAKRQTPNVQRLPALTIADHPDFPRRGVYHDTARGKVPQLDTLLQLIDDLASLKINEFQLYVENNFEFRRHPEMFDDTTPLTAEDLLVIDEFCRQRHIDFVPSLTSLGHFEKILTRPAFAHLAEAQPQQLKAIGAPCWVDQPWSLCVTDPAARQFLKDMYDEFLPNFSSPTFNICCDEAYDLGKVRSKNIADKTVGGASQMYVDWINYCHSLAQSHGKRIAMWGDIIRNHPELLPQLPPDTTLIEWGYEADHDWDTRCKVFADSGLRWYVAPGTSGWFTLSSRTKNAFANMHHAAAAGLKHGAAGFLITDWGDNGHQQMLSVSLLAFAYGAAISWHAASLPNPSKSQASSLKPIPDAMLMPKPTTPTKRPAPGHKCAATPADLPTFLRAASIHLFQDPTARFASLAYDLGLTYERFGWQRFNASVDWFLFREKFDFANYVNRVTPADLRRVESATEKLFTQFNRAEILHPDADLIRAEFLFTCREILHTAARTRIRQQWLAADPAKRNPEEPTKVHKKPVPLNKKSFPANLRRLAKDARELRSAFRTLWLARNKPSRLQDVLAEFDRCTREYQAFARPEP